MVKIVQIEEVSLKEEICNNILRSLPKWFGIEESIAEYVKSVYDKDFFVALDGEEYIGFFAVGYPFNKMANLHVLGVKQEYHHKGVGTMLYRYVETYVKDKGCKYISVYTLSNKSNDEYYARTRDFYHKMGFVDAYESDKIWGDNNPFLLMVKFLA